MKRIFLAILAALLTASPSYAESLTLTTYYPAPFGAYDRLRLVPRSPLTGSCDIGTMYVESPDIFNFCVDGGGGIGEWQPLSVWTQSNDNIYPTDSTNPNLYVGIGTTNPDYPLSVYSSVEIPFQVRSSNTAMAAITVRNSSSAKEWALLTVGSTAGPWGGTGNFAIDESNGGARLVIVPGGNVGIGQTAPSRKLNIKSAGPQLMLEQSNSTAGDSGWEFFADTSIGYLSFTRMGSLQGEKVRILSNGNVGIGTTAPSEKLEVVGTIKITAGTPGVGKVLTSDATGVATWTAPGSVPSGVIVMWSGSVASIPAGWVLCNGANGTPDLRDRFIMGAGSSYNPGQTGGQATINLQHNHGGRTGGVVFNAPDGVLTAGALDMRHNHPISNDLSSAQSILPPYYALAYIMKL